MQKINKKTHLNAVNHQSKDTYRWKHFNDTLKFSLLHIMVYEF